jgi:hypothetical protein
MDWQAVFSDINAWMQESNRTMQQHPITTDEYWTWLVRSIVLLFSDLQRFAVYTVKWWDVVQDCFQVKKSFYY